MLKEHQSLWLILSLMLGCFSKALKYTFKSFKNNNNNGSEAWY